MFFKHPCFGPKKVLESCGTSENKTKKLSRIELGPLSDFLFSPKHAHFSKIQVSEDWNTGALKTACSLKIQHGGACHL